MSEIDQTSLILGELREGAKRAETARVESANDREQIKKSIGAIQAAIIPLVTLPERVDNLETVTAALKTESDERRGASRVTAAMYGAGGSGVIIALTKAATWIGFLPR